MQVSKTPTAMSEPTALAVQVASTLLVALLDATRVPRALPMTTASRRHRAYLVKLGLLRLKATLAPVSGALQASTQVPWQPNA